MSCSDSVSLLSAACSTGTLDALNRTMNGGVVPGGAIRRIVSEMADTCAMAPAMSVPGWKNTFSTAYPVNDSDSMCSMLSTVVVMPRSCGVMIVRSMSSGDSPAYVQMTVTTGISIDGKMSVAMLLSVTTPKIRISIAMTMNVYGRLSPNWTIHIPTSENAPPKTHRA